MPSFKRLQFEPREVVGRHNEDRLLQLLPRRQLPAANHMLAGKENELTTFTKGILSKFLVHSLYMPAGKKNELRIYLDSLRLETCLMGTGSTNSTGTGCPTVKS